MFNVGTVAKISAFMLTQNKETKEHLTDSHNIKDKEKSKLKHTK